MNPEVKKLWIAALKSGKYKQARKKLRRRDTFCCLGVLCDLHRKTVKKNRWVSDKLSDSLVYAGEEMSLPDVVLQWAGLTSSDPHVAGQSLATWNDEQCASFEEIAELIDINL